VCSPFRVESIAKLCLEQARGVVVECSGRYLITANASVRSVDDTEETAVGVREVEVGSQHEVAAIPHRGLERAPDGNDLYVIGMPALDFYRDCAGARVPTLHVC
jgi:hypothetical protein